MGKIRMGDLSKEISEEELQEIENDEKRKPVFDEDCPTMTDEQLHEFKSIGEAIVHTEDQEEMEKMKAAQRYMCEMNKGIRAGEEGGWLSIDQVRAHMKERRHAEEG